MGLRSLIGNIIKPVEDLSVSIGTATGEMRNEVVQSAAKRRDKRKSEIDFEKIENYFTDQKRLDDIISSRFE